MLHDLSFTFPPGATSAIIGGTGSGKTTLLNLIPRFADATGGSVLVNGVDVRDQEREELWAGIGLVPQAAFLFSGTVASNLRFGRPEATEAELWHALQIAQARDFVAAMPGQLDAPIDQGGTNVSGGQRQRLSIARALVKRPRLYLFDDCFSALDAATDARLRMALKTGTRGATVVIVAQRVSTIMHADQIIVLDEGRVAGVGTHRELMAGCRDQVRRCFGMVLQDTWLFAGTIRDNIGYGKQDATAEEIAAAARAAYADHFIRTLPDGYDTLLDEDASNLSAGQKQLLTIARAFLASPPILILDEATSNVDTRTEILIQEAMSRLRQGRTSFVIAHRLSTIRNADTIVVMDAGHIVEQGSHADLLRRHGFYYSLYNSQFTEDLAEAS